eukprot:CAMPEP_0205925930 /NCGR_PEP_ID=MMETSP1325-20131115/19301_1 /ASSEMBLY_ACC=CAM_ASM_000708 /TAXON_ID=236786 /ORGANISM="Florenciella sp., Strain RCC1007" /LENGTH=76 /DNA_ID=CAMNT_0053294553 /DNA_START=5 /DNA_END=231 /DNA_ORIENTATION=+
MAALETTAFSEYAEVRPAPAHLFSPLAPLTGALGLQSTGLPFCVAAAAPRRRGPLRTPYITSFASVTPHPPLSRLT